MTTSAILESFRPAGEPPMPSPVRDPAHPARDVPLADKLAGRIEGLASAAEAMRDQAKGAVGNMSASDRSRAASHARRAKADLGKIEDIMENGQ